MASYLLPVVNNWSGTISCEPVRTNTISAWHALPDIKNLLFYVSASTAVSAGVEAVRLVTIAGTSWILSGSATKLTIGPHSLRFGL
jgi:hypothetical protein